MKAIGLWQPWATLVAIGAKRIETRHWHAPLGLLGERIAIHATKAGPPKYEERELYLVEEHFAAALAPALGCGTDPEAIMRALPRGAIVCTAVLARCTEITAARTAQLERTQPAEFAFGDYTPGRFAWVLDDVRPVAPPMPVRGGQGFFEAPPELEELATGVMTLEGIA